MAGSNPQVQDGQYFSTTILAPEPHSGAFTVLVVPKRVISNSVDPDKPALAVLDLDKGGSPFSPPNDGHGLAIILARFWFNQEQSPPQELIDAAIDTITNTAIPIENSPLSGETLFQIFNHGGAVGVGTLVAFQVFGASSPILLLAVPGNIILIGAAIGLAKGLENGLAKKVYSLIQRRNSAGTTGAAH
jgi:hypothetical protein